MSDALDHTILIVDDEPLLRMVLVDVFDDAGFFVFEAASAHEALHMLKGHPDIRAVVTDIQMPGSMDGLELAAYIRDAYPPIALIIASGALTPTASELPEDAVFMQKPVNSDVLLQRVKTLIAQGA